MLNREPLFWQKVHKIEGGCWEWTGAIGRYGYGYFSIGPSRSTHAHRYSYKLAHGDIPEGLEIDHLCRNRKCVNPAHLEAVTHKINNVRGMSVSGQNARKTECKYGHPFNEANTYWYTTKTGEVARQCRTCREARIAIWNAAAKLKRTGRPVATMCKHGHPFDVDNTTYYKDGQGKIHRQCKACHKVIEGRRKKSRQARSWAGMLKPWSCSSELTRA